METRVLPLCGVNVFVTFTGQGRPFLCLHGWGKSVSSEAFTPLRGALRDAPVQVIAPDLPGFGRSGEPPRPWAVNDYADCVEELVSTLGLRDVFLLGHSFGGRIAITLAARASTRPASAGLAQHDKWIAHLFLCAAAGVGRDLLIRRRFWLSVAKLGNAFFRIPGLAQLKPFARRILYKLLRVHDYETATEGMRRTMAIVIEEDLTPLLSKIRVPTDIFWGADDRITPLADAHILNKKIVQSELHTFPGVRHNVHRERAREIAGVIKAALS